MTNFDIFLRDPDFAAFAEPAAAAERIYHIDPAACVLNCRRAMEAAVKWMYSVDGDLVLPWDQTLVVLMGTDEFRDIVGTDLWRRLDLIRKKGNSAAHSGSKISADMAALCLEDLYIYLDFIACCYGKEYEAREFDRALLDGERIATAPAEPRNDRRCIIYATGGGNNSRSRRRCSAAIVRV